METILLFGRVVRESICLALAVLSLIISHSPITLSKYSIATHSALVRNLSDQLSNVCPLK